MKIPWKLALSVFVAAGLCADAVHAAKKKKKDEEPETQTLEAIPDPPMALPAEVGRLVFKTAPYTTKGLLSQQMRDSIRALWKLNGRAQIVKVRALVAGTGDLRRVQSLVAEMFSEKHQQIPVVSVVQVGALPVTGAQVLLESYAVERKVVNPNGLAFISGKGATAKFDPQNPDTKVVPLAAKSIADLRTALTGIGATSADTVRVTCFMSSLDDHAQVQSLVSQEFPGAGLAFAQTQRSPTHKVVECEAIARLKESPGAAWKVVNPPGLTASPNFSQVAVAGPGKVVITGTQLAFRAQDADVRLAFERLNSQLEPLGSSMKQVFWSGIYSLSEPITAKVRALRFEFYDKANPPASTLMEFEGLPSLDSTFALEVIAGIR
jgi:enamine deaminase RidA (YjgF/YER057c/UK114 family)